MARMTDGFEFNGAERLDDLPPELKLRLYRLAPREIEATLLYGKGYFLGEVAEQMQVTESTAKTHLRRAGEKLGCETVRNLRVVLLRKRIIRPDELRDPEGSSDAE